MNRYLIAAAVLLILAGPAAAGDWQNPDAEWIRVTGADIESRVGGREMLGKYADDPRRFRAVFRRNGDFREEWSPAATVPDGRTLSAVGERWFVEGELMCEDAPEVAGGPFCAELYEMADANVEAYRFVNAETGRLISYTTEVRWIEPLY